ncbi:hypothetical protein DPMN_166319 [Dreissena polymorpha]|uniref:Uncharacterized protein n=1 Tax=Dreissena polymorpha TaxID=45954 RepID=A0A9D4F1A5_DREPO|nr:hypothetical protein DPMN_166319 [Dreissena polymorpha]
MALKRVTQRRYGTEQLTERSAKKTYVTQPLAERFTKNVCNRVTGREVHKERM